MLLWKLQEVPLLRATFLLSQEKSKRSLKSIKPDIDEMTNIFGKSFLRNLLSLLFEEIDFRDIDAYMNSKNLKAQYFFQEFNTLLDAPDFFEIFTEICMQSKNISNLNEIIEGLTHAMNLSDESVIKVLICFVRSNNMHYEADAKGKLIGKILDLEKEEKLNEVSEATIEELIYLFANRVDEEVKKKEIIEILSNVIYRSSTDFTKSTQDLFDLKFDDLVRIEDIYNEIGPKIINSGINLNKSELIDFDVDESRLANFILNVLNQQTFNEDKETKIMNKVLLSSLELDKETKLFDETVENEMIEWNMEKYYKANKEKIDSLNKKLVLMSLDSPIFIVKDQKKFEFFLTILKNLNLYTPKNEESVSTFFEFILKPWTNDTNHVEFLKFLIQNPPSNDFNFQNFKGKRVNAHIEQSISKPSTDFLVEPWTCIELIRTLLTLSRGNNYVKIKEMFIWPIQHIPEIITHALIQIEQKPSDFLYDELIQEVLTLFLGNHMNSFSVIEEVWEANKDLVIHAIANMYNTSPNLMNLSRILDITQKLKDSLLLLVGCDDYHFSVNLAVLAVKRDFLHIEQWLKERIESVGDDFVLALLEYINANLVIPCRGNNSRHREGILEKSQLTMESLAVILENLLDTKHERNAKISLSTEEKINEIYKAIYENFQELQIEPIDSKEIEDTANSIFQAMFKGERKISETIEELRVLKESSSHKEREIYGCMIHCLLDEYRFYHQYPEKQLITISTLFGQIINNKLVDGVIETIALKYIIEGIKKGSGPLYTFGITALKQFIEILPTLPTYTKSLVETMQLKKEEAIYEMVCEKYTQTLTNDPANLSNLSNQPQLNLNPLSNIGLNSENLLNPQINIRNIPGQINTKLYNNLMQPPMFEEQNKGLRKPSEQFNQMMYNKMQENTFYNQNINLQNPLMSSPQPMNMMGNNLNLSNIPNLSINQMEDINSPFNSGNPFLGKIPKGQIPLNIEEVKKISAKNQNKHYQNLQNNLALNNMDIYWNEENPNITLPGQEMNEQIKFVFSQINSNNLIEKGNELKSLLINENIIKWFSDYIILSKILPDISNHSKVIELVNLIEIKSLNDNLVNDTLRYIHRIFQKNIENEKERNILMNLGNWLGLMTLKKSKPIWAKDLDFRELIGSAYESGKLLIVIPFLCKILEHCVQNKVFQEKNPWLRAILSILLEIYKQQNVRHILKAEIEGLFKKLNIELDSLPESNYLLNKNYVKPAVDYSKNIPSSKIGPSIAANIFNNNEVHPEYYEQNQQIQKEIYAKICQNTNYLNDIGLMLEEKKLLNVLNKKEILQILTTFLSESISEIINPVIERAVNISLVTTKELVIKDFKYDANEENFKLAACNSIKSLAGSLALVTSKEPLRLGFSKKLKECLLNKEIEEAVIEEIIKSKNFAELLNIGSNYIYNFVLKKAVEKIMNDETILNEIERRKNNGANFIVTQNSKTLQAIMAKIPQLLIPNPKGLTKEQMSIYENYAKVYGDFNKPEINSKKGLTLKIQHALKEIVERPSNQVAKIYKSYEMCMQNIQSLMKDHNFLQKNAQNPKDFDSSTEESKMLEKCIVDNKFSELEMSANELRKLYSQLLLCTFNCAVNAYEHKYYTLLNVYLAFVKGWTAVQPTLTKDLSSALLSNAYVNFDITFQSYMIKKGLINMKEYEEGLKYLIDHESTRKRCIKLLTNFYEKKFLPQDYFKKIPSFLLNYEVSEEYFKLFGFSSKLPGELNANQQCVIDYKICNIKDLATYEVFNKMCYFAFNKILATKYPVQMVETSELEKKLNNFISSPFVNNEEQLNVFIMLITELCNKRIVSANSSHDNFPENEAKCIYTLLTAVKTNTNKIKLFGNILNGIYKTFHWDYIKSGYFFNQRPYYKLFVYFLHLLSGFKNTDKIFNSDFTKMNFMSVLGEFFRLLMPVNYPSFTLAWLDLIASRNFITCFIEDNASLVSKDNRSLENYLCLLIDLMNYLKGNVNTLLSEKGTKIFLDKVYIFMFYLCNTYPEFISGYYYIFLISLPSGAYFTQLKNLLLNATPKKVEKINAEEFAKENLSEILNNKVLGKNKIVNLFDISSILKEYNYQSLIENYIMTRDENIISEICNKLNSSKNKIFNYYAINATVVFWGDRLLKENIKVQCDFFLTILNKLELENRGYFINSLLNELRYPSNQTVFFVTVICDILCVIKNISIEEHIVSKLLERLMFKPVPWGIELLYYKLKSKEGYDLEEKEFIKEINFGLCKQIDAFLKDEKAVRFQIKEDKSDIEGENKGNEENNIH